MAAGLDPRVTLCLASVPAMCDHTGLVIGQANGWPKMLKADRGKLDPKAAEVVRYFDAMNFATRIKCPTVVSVGFVDKACAPTSVFAAYNNIPAGVKKQIVMRPAMGHTFPQDLIKARRDPRARGGDEVGGAYEVISFPRRDHVIPRYSEESRARASLSKIEIPRSTAG